MPKVIIGDPWDNAVAVRGQVTARSWRPATPARCARRARGDGERLRDAVAKTPNETILGRQQAPRLIYHNIKIQFDLIIRKKLIKCAYGK